MSSQTSESVARSGANWLSETRAELARAPRRSERSVVAPTARRRSSGARGMEAKAARAAPSAGCSQAEGLMPGKLRFRSMAVSYPIRRRLGRPVPRGDNRDPLKDQVRREDHAALSL